jgi:hypothetical protein
MLAAVVLILGYGAAKSLPVFKIHIEQVGVFRVAFEGFGVAGLTDGQ